MKNLCTYIFVFLLASVACQKPAEDSKPVEKTVAFPTAKGGLRHTLVIDSDNKLWAWGYNYKGQLGIGSKVNQNSPVQVGTDSNWKAISVGNAYSLALKNDGTLWAWGAHHYGKDGLEANTHQDRPEQIAFP